MCPELSNTYLEPIGEQTVEEVKEYARTVMRGLREAMQYDEIEKLFDVYSN